jgi:hypothetical protein
MKKGQQEIDSSQNYERRDVGKPHFQLESNRMQELHDRVNALRLGESRAQVAASVGPSDREELLGPKKGVDWTCRGLVYNVLIVGDLPGNGMDRRIELIFDRQDKLIAILSNVDGIDRRGDMTRCR